MNRRGVIAAFAAASACGLVILGIAVSGTPGETRGLRNDQRRSSDLSTIAYAADVASQADGAPPPSLAYLVALGRLSPDVKDPSTGAAYEYRALDGRRFELCATFERPSSTQAPRPIEPGPRERDFFTHDKGRTCFETSVPAPQPKTAP